MGLLPCGTAWGPLHGATDGPMVSAEQWWGRGPGIARPKQEVRQELQRTGRAKGPRAGAGARTGSGLRGLPALGCPAWGEGVGAAVKGSWGGGQRRLGTLCVAATVPGAKQREMEPAPSCTRPHQPARRGCRFFPRPASEHPERAGLAPSLLPTPCLLLPAALLRAFSSPLPVHTGGGGKWREEVGGGV